MNQFGGLGISSLVRFCHFGVSGTDHVAVWPYQTYLQTWIKDICEEKKSQFTCKQKV